MPRSASPAAKIGPTVSSMYLRVAKGWSRTPSASRAAVFSMSGPTAAMVTGTMGRWLGPGENSSFIRLKR